MTDTETAEWKGAAQLEPFQTPIGGLIHLPRNARRGDVDAIAASLQEFGQLKPIVVRRTTKEGAAKQGGVVIAGNHMYEAAKKLGWDVVAAVFVDTDQKTADRFALADNRTAELGTYDEGVLAEVLGEIAAEGGLVGTGWGQDDLDALLFSLRHDEQSKDATGTQQVAERTQGYLAQAIRSLVTPFSVAEYESVTNGIAALREAWNMQTTSDVIMRLVEEACEAEQIKIERTEEVHDDDGPETP